MTFRLSFDNRARYLFNFAALNLVLFCVSLVAANGQTSSENTTGQENSTPVFREYRGIKIGTPQPELQTKLGAPRSSDDTMLTYEFSADESALIKLDKKKRVVSIVIYYSAGLKEKPQYADVFGKDAVEPVRANGSVYNIVRYEKAGYSVAYSRTSGENPTTSITLQKLE
jgi:hypothetical protein